MAKKTDKQRYLLIDGNAIIHRGFHAIPALTTQSGEHTNAVYGFTMILLRAIKDLKPTHIACSFDLAGPTFRHEEYLDYKATRVKVAQELYDQIPRVKQVVQTLNIPIFEKQGFEADDVLGTLANQICSKHSDDVEVMIATGDLDALQLVNKCVKVYTLRKGLSDTTVYDAKAVTERFGFGPEHIIDYKALRGDASDNIKGVKGIGEKTATDLIQQFGGIDEIYHAIKTDKNIEEKIKPRPLKLLREGEADARLSYKLATIVTDVELDFKIDPYEFTSVHLDAALKLFQELEFRSLIDKLPKNYLPVKVVQEAQAAQLSGAANLREQDYRLVDTPEKLDKLLKLLSKQNELAVDTETDQLNPIEAQVIGASLCFKDGQGFYVTRDMIDQSQELQALLSDKKLQKIGHNMKYDLLTLQNMGLQLSPLSFDTMLASYLLHAGTRQHGLSALAFNMLGYQMQPIEDLIGKGAKQISMADVEVSKVSWYACEDADITFRIKSILEKQLKEEKLDKVFYDIEMPMIPVLARMERCGILVDVKFLQKLSQKAEKEIVKLEQKIYKQAGQEFNINSPKQLQEILYEKLGLTAGKKNKTGRSTAASVLEKLQHEHKIVKDILSYRELSKLKSTYLDALPGMVNPRTKRIHTNYNQTIAATGRLSSTDPNLQNIPIRGQGLGSEVRKAFVAQPGYKLVALDYSQIELRIVAHLAQDKNMMEVFKDRGDIHTRTASAIFEVAPDKVTSDMRRDAKIVNFGILYGLSGFGLTERISEVDFSTAQDFIDKYFVEYPQVKDYIEKTKMRVRENAQVINELGRVRKFPEVTSSQYFIRQAAERAAINFPIQSLSADIIKLAMIEIDKLIKDSQDEVCMLLQVHDELVFEIREDSIEKWVDKLKLVMENTHQLSVPITVDAKMGDNWGEMQPIK